MFTRYEMYSILLRIISEGDDYPESLVLYIQSLVLLMKDIDHFMSLGIDESIVENRYDEIHSLIRGNYNNANELINELEVLDSFIEISKLIFNDFKKEGDIVSYDVKNIVFRYMKVIAKYSEEIFNKHIDYFNIFIQNLNLDVSLFLLRKESIYFREKNVDIERRAFFSYAYDDKLYTLGFFLFFLENKVLLYIDWIFNGRVSKAEHLKKFLDAIMQNCDYFLFLRTLNSELSMRGNSQIRQWCSWEIGNYYQYSHKNKFYIETIDISTGKNSLLDNFESLERIEKLHI